MGVKIDETVVEPTTVVVVAVTVSVDAVMAASAGGVPDDVAVDAALPPANVEAPPVADEEDAVVTAVVASDMTAPEEVEVEACVLEDGIVSWQNALVVVVVETAVFANPIWSVGFD